MKYYWLTLIYLEDEDEDDEQDIDKPNNNINTCIICI